MQKDPTETVNDAFGVSLKKRDSDDDTPILESIRSYSGNISSLWDSDVLKSPYIALSVRKIATDVASQRFTYDDDSNNRLLRLLNFQPNERMNAFDFWSAMVSQCLLNGMSFAFIERTGNRVSSLTPIPTERMTVTVDTNSNQATYLLDNDKKLNPNDLLIIKFFSVDGIKGISPIQALNEDLNIQKNKNKLLNKVFSSNFIGRQVLKLNTDATLDAEAKANIRNKFTKVNNDPTAPIVIDKDFDLSELPVNEELIQTANDQEWSIKDISAMFCIPLDYYGRELDHSSNQMSSTMWLQQGLVGYFAPILSEINSKLVPKGHQVDVDFSNLFSASASDNVALEQQKFNLYEAEFEKGLITADEFREKMGLPPKKGDESE